MKFLEARYGESDLYDDDFCCEDRDHVNYCDYYCCCSYNYANHDLNYGGDRAIHDEYYDGAHDRVNRDESYGYCHVSDYHDGYNDCDHRDNVNHGESYAGGYYDGYRYHDHDGVNYVNYSYFLVKREVINAQYDNQIIPDDLFINKIHFKVDIGVIHHRSPFFSAFSFIQVSLHKMNSPFQLIIIIIKFKLLIK